MHSRNPSAPRIRGFLCGVLTLALTAGCASDRQFVSDDSHARNVILFIGDGMGVSTVTAARIFAGQAAGLAGEEHSLAFETFPNLALVKTWNTNQQVPDSAGSATAMYTGHKTRAGVLSVGPEARRRNCAEALAHPLTTIRDHAKSRGKAVGIVTTTRITHVTTAAELPALQPDDEVLGLFGNGHLSYVAERAAGTTEPSLPEMTAAAIDRLASFARPDHRRLSGARQSHPGAGRRKRRPRRAAPGPMPYQASSSRILWSIS